MKLQKFLQDDFSQSYWFTVPFTAGCINTSLLNSSCSMNNQVKGRRQTAFTTKHWHHLSHTTISLSTGSITPCLCYLDKEDVSCNTISDRKCPYQQNLFLMYWMEKTKPKIHRTQWKIRYLYGPIHLALN